MRVYIEFNTSIGTAEKNLKNMMAKDCDRYIHAAVIGIEFISLYCRQVRQIWDVDWEGKRKIYARGKLLTENFPECQFYH